MDILELKKLAGINLTEDRNLKILTSRLDESSSEMKAMKPKVETLESLRAEITEAALQPTHNVKRGHSMMLSKYPEHGEKLDTMHRLALRKSKRAEVKGGHFHADAATANDEVSKHLEKHGFMHLSDFHKRLAAKHGVWQGASEEVETPESEKELDERSALARGYKAYRRWAEKGVKTPAGNLAPSGARWNISKKGVDTDTTHTRSGEHADTAAELKKPGAAGSVARSWVAGQKKLIQKRRAAKDSEKGFQPKWAASDPNSTAVARVKPLAASLEYSIANLVAEGDKSARKALVRSWRAKQSSAKAFPSDGSYARRSAILASRSEMRAKRFGDKEGAELARKSKEWFKNRPGVWKSSGKKLPLP